MQSNTDKKTTSNRSIGISIFANLFSSICIVMLNKALFTHHKFPNMTLTCIHFTMTSIGLKICLQFDVFNARSLPLKRMLPLSLAFCGFVALTNVSLQYNTVGTYQLIKVLTTPCIMFIHTMFYRKTYSIDIVLTLLPIALGVFLNSYYDVKFSVFGTMVALLGVVVTSFYQVLVGALQADLHVNAMQLLNYQAPLSAGLLACIIPFFEPVNGVGGIFHSWPEKVWVLVILSGVVAFSINLSTFWIIGNLSPVTYNMVGHTKFCLTLLAGYLFFNDNIMSNRIFGILLTFSGILMYTHLKIKQQSAKPQFTRRV